MYRLLNRFYRSSSLTSAQVGSLANQKKPGEIEKRLRQLQQLKLIEPIHGEPDQDGYAKILGYRITLDGMAYVEEHRRAIWMFWLPYSITTGIALAALLLSLQQ